MPDPFATVADLESRWRPLSSQEAAQAEVLLADASAILRAQCPTIDQRITDGTLDPELPEMVTCSMVKRAMMAADMGDGVTTQQQTAGPFSASLSFANPMGNLYSTKAEKQLLGCGARARAYTIDTTPRPDTTPTPEDQLVDVERVRFVPTTDPLDVVRAANGGQLPPTAPLAAPEAPVEVPPPSWATPVATEAPEDPGG
jgi:hypothetical protein